MINSINNNLYFHDLERKAKMAELSTYSNTL